jgi:integration host factor subunit alpha
MTKAEIVQAIYDRLGGFSKKEAADLVDLVFETMKETLGRGEKIKVSGFGNFVLRDKRQRQGRNPQTGDPILITERRVLSFKASNILRHELNTGESTPGSNRGASSHAGNGGQAAASAPHNSEAAPMAARSSAAAPASATHAASAPAGDAWSRRGSGGSSG